MASNPPRPPKTPHLRLAGSGDEPPRKITTRAQRIQLTNVVEQLMLDGQRIDQIAIVLDELNKREGRIPTVSRYLLRQVMTTVEQQWQEDARTTRAVNRQKAVNRNLRHMREARKAGKWLAVKGFEDNIAKLQGLNAPDHLQISFAQNEHLLRIIGESDDQTVRKLAEEQEEILRKAELYDNSIDTLGEPVLPDAPPQESSLPALPEKSNA